MRNDCARNIILIGMPGAGKSTIGVLLAKRLGYNFIDTDLLIQAVHQRRLQQIIAEDGMEPFKVIEEQVLLDVECSHTVVATGGSAIYSQEAMEHLKKLGTLVYLDIPMEVLQKRIEDMDSRGLVIDPDESFEKLFEHRTPLYLEFADLVVSGEDLTAEAVAATIEGAVCTL